MYRDTRGSITFIYIPILFAISESYECQGLHKAETRRSALQRGTKEDISYSD